MSDALDKAFEAQILRAMGGEDPIVSAKLVTVSSMSFDQVQTVKAALREEQDHWKDLQIDMRKRKVMDSSSEWKEAREEHKLLVDVYKAQIALNQKIGNPRKY
jgi:3-keto-L-gulonate-6-phosphate decarboxylase